MVAYIDEDDGRRERVAELGPTYAELRAELDAARARVAALEAENERLRRDLTLARGAGDELREREADLLEQVRRLSPYYVLDAVPAAGPTRQWGVRWPDGQVIECAHEGSARSWAETGLAFAQLRH